MPCSGLQNGTYHFAVHCTAFFPGISVKLKAGIVDLDKPMSDKTKFVIKLLMSLLILIDQRFGVSAWLTGSLLITASQRDFLDRRAE